MIKGLGLKAKFILWLAVFVPSIMLAAYWYFSRHEQEALANEIRLRGRTICTALAKAAEEPLVQHDDLSLAKLVADARTVNPGVIFCLVTDNQGRILAHTDIFRVKETYSLPSQARRIGDLYEYRTREGIEIFHLIQPIRLGQKTLGQAHVAISQESIRRAISQAGRGMLWVTALMMAAGLAAIMFLTSMIIGSLGRLTGDIQAIGDGDLDRNIVIDRRDELGRIALAVKEMAAKLKVARQQLIEQERLKREMQIAREIQNSILPKSEPRVSGLQVATLYQPAAEVGGDYFDFIELEAGKLGLVVADVSGKGVGGSLVMAMLRSILRIHAGQGQGPGRLIANVNQALKQDIPEGMFVTLFYAEIDPGAKNLSYCCAGHHPGLIRRGDGSLLSLKRTGPPLGIDLDGTSPGHFREERQRFLPGDLLLVFTDGLTEARSPSGQEFGQERLLQFLSRSDLHRPEAIKDSLSSVLGDFMGRTPQSDDLTLVLIANTGNQP